MNLSSLTSITTKSKKRGGLGHGSGRGKTAGRGTKGQKARRNISLSFEGGALPLIKRMPFRRGKAKNFSFNSSPVVINVGKLGIFTKGSVVDHTSLVEKKFATARELRVRGVKILGDGQLSVSLVVKVPVSKSAKEKIEKAGGNIVV